jgi:hypothetical protein
MDKNHLNRKGVIKFIIAALLTKLIVANWDEIKRVLFE